MPQGLNGPWGVSRAQALYPEGEDSPRCLSSSGPARGPYNTQQSAANTTMTQLKVLRTVGVRASRVRRNRAAMAPVSVEHGTQRNKPEKIQ